MANFTRQIDAGTVVKRVIASLGLPMPVGAVSEATDPTSRQMWALLNECGQDLISEFNWQFLNREFLLTTTPGVTEYPLPADFQSFIDSTGWNNTARIPLIGPLTEQQWRLLQARQLGGTTLRMQYIISGDKIVFYWVPSEPQQIAIEYTGRGWVRGGTPPAYLDNPQQDSDLVLYAPRLIISCLKERWRRAKGFDTTADYVEYTQQLDQAKYNDRPKNDLAISGRGNYPYLGYLNMPDTNFGGS